MQLETAEPGSMRTTPPVAPAIVVARTAPSLWFGGSLEWFGFDGPNAYHSWHPWANGCGKTTLFRLISTLVRVQAGTIQLFGQDISKHQAWARQQIGIVFQAPSLDKSSRYWRISVAKQPSMVCM